MKPLLHLGSNVITDRPLLHLGLVITFVPSTSSTDKKSGSLKWIWPKRPPKHLASLVAFSGESYFPIYTSLQIKRRSNEKIEANVAEIKDEKKFPLFVCADAHQVQDYIGERGTFALKRGQKWNSPKLILFHKCFSAQRGRIFPSFPNARGRDCTESWFACGSSTVVFVHCRGGNWNCYSYKFKFFIHFLLEVFPRNLLRSSMES